MGFPLFVARKIYTSKADKKQVSRPAVRIATLGVAVGLAVMIVSVDSSTPSATKSSASAAISQWQTIWPCRRQNNTPYKWATPW